MKDFRTQVKRILKNLGAELEVDKIGHHYTINIDAPIGYHWKVGPHCISAYTTTGFENEAWKEALYMIKQGLELCDRECECNVL